MRRRPWLSSVTTWTTLAGALLLLLLAGADAHAERRDYPLDEDPIRLGERALEENRLPEAEEHFGEALRNDYRPARAQLGLARIATLEGRLEDAEAYFRTALQTRRQRDDDDYPEARAGLGLLLMRLGRTAEAQMEFDRALEEQDDLWPARFGQAWILLQKEDYDAARRRLEEGRTRQGRAEREDLYHFGMALLHLGRGELDEAEPEALRALNLNPTNAEYARLVGRIYEQRNAPTLAIDAYEKALAAPGMEATAPMLRTLGGLYQRVERYNEARDRYLAAVRVDSTYAPAWKDLGQLFERAGQHQRAAQTFLRYVTLVDDDVEALVDLANSCLEIGRDAQALEAARAAVQLESGDSDVRLTYARAALRSRDETAKAEAAGILADLQDPQALTPADWVALAAFQTQRRQYGQASESVRRALAVDPRYARAHFQQGVIDLSRGQPDAAVQSLQAAVEIDPDVAGYHLNLGIAQYQRQNLEGAIAAFRQALELRGDLTVARLLLAQALALTGSIEAATEQYQKVLDEEPRHAKALRGLGYCHLRSSRYEDAAQAYEKANEIEADNADGWAGLGNAYLGLEDLDAAEQAFQRAKKIDPDNATMRKGMELLEQARAAASQR